jgi:hypothetical protein
LEDRQLLSGFQLRLEQPGFAPLNISDNGPGDVNPQAGAITFIGAYGTFPVNVITGISSPGSSGEQHLILNALNLAGPQGGALRILLAADDILLPGDGGQPLLLRSAYGGTLFGEGAAVGHQSWADPGNQNEAAGHSPGPLNSSSSSMAFSGESSTSFNPQSTPYSLVSELNVALPGGGLQSVGAITTLSALRGGDDEGPGRPDPE